MTAREDLAAVATEGIVGVSIIAGHIRVTDQPVSRIGQQVVMGRDGDFTLHITPETARQWLPVIQQIANEGTE